MIKLISFKKIYLSFRNSFAGLRVAFIEEQSFRIQLAVMLVVITAMFIFHLHYLAKALIVSAIVFVLSLEILNTQIERTLDLLHPGQHPQVKKIKDLAAAAVLVAVSGAFIVGVIVFIADFIDI